MSKMEVIALAKAKNKSLAESRKKAKCDWILERKNDIEVLDQVASE